MIGRHGDGEQDRHEHILAGVADDTASTQRLDGGRDLDATGELLESAPVREPIDTLHVVQARAVGTMQEVLAFATTVAGIAEADRARLAVITEAMLRLCLPAGPGRRRRTHAPLSNWTIERLRKEVGGQGRGRFSDPMDIRMHVASHLAIRALMVTAGRSVIYEEYVARPLRIGARQKTASGSARSANASAFAHIDAVTLGGSDRQLTASGWTYVPGTTDSHAHANADRERIADLDAQVRRLFPAENLGEGGDEANLKRNARFDAVNGRRYPGTPAEALSWQLALVDEAYAAACEAPDSAFAALRLPDGRRVTRERFIRAGFSRRLIVRALPHGPSGPGVASSGTDLPGLDAQLVAVAAKHRRQALLYAGPLPDAGWPQSGTSEPAELSDALPLAIKLGIDPSPNVVGRLRWASEIGELARMITSGPTAAERWRLVDLDVAAAAALIARSDLEWPVDCLTRQETSSLPGMIQPPKIKSKTGILHLLRLAVAVIVHDEREGRVAPEDRPDLADRH